MKWTQEELHELNQMIDMQINRIYANQIEYFNSCSGVEPELVEETVSKFIQDSIKNRDLLETIRVKINGSINSKK